MSLVETSCDLCGSALSRPIIKRDFCAFPCNVSICREDGLVKLNPRWDDATYRHFYTNKYECFYRGPGLSPRELLEIDLKHKGPVLKTRLSRLNFTGAIKVLDIGAGTGWSFLSLPEHLTVKSFAVEPSPKCHPILRELGVTVLAEDVTTMEETKPYDLVIARHVVEHATDALSFLRSLRSLVDEKGYIYVAVPNVMNFCKDKADSFFRVIHTYYFNIYTLLTLSRKAGLYPVMAGAETEIWGILSPRPHEFDIPYVSAHEQQNVIDDIARRSRHTLGRRVKALLNRIRYAV